MERELSECKLFAPVKAWLEAQGYKVFAEMWGYDVVAIVGEHVVAVELKTTCSRKLITQVRRAPAEVDAAYGAVPVAPRRSSVELMARYGLGLLIVGDRIDVRLQPARKCFEPQRRQLIDALSRWQPDDRVGGVPTLAGDGEAIRCVARVKAYREQHPGATWRDIFRDVPNHYAHHKSMQQSVRKAEEWQQLRQRRAAQSSSNP